MNPIIETSPNLSGPNEPEQNYIDVLNDLAWATIPEDRERAQQMAEEARRLSQTGFFSDKPYEKGLAEGLVVLGRVNSYQFQNDKALAYSLEARKVLERLGYSPFLGRAMMTTATVYLNLGDYSRSQEEHYALLSMAEEMADLEGQAFALLGLGSVYGILEDYKISVTYLEKGLELFRELGNSYWAALSLTNMAQAYINLQENDLALSCCQEVLDVCHQAGAHHRIQSFALITIGEIYNQQGQKEAALCKIQESLALAETLGDIEFRCESLRQISEWYLEEAQFEPAIKILQEALELLEKHAFRRDIYKFHERLSQAYEMQGDLQQSLWHYKQFHQFREVAFGEESDRRIKNLEVLHQTQSAQKEAQLYASLYQEEQNRRLLAETLQEVGTVLSSTLNIGIVLEMILEQLEQVVQYERGSLLLMHDACLEFVATRHFPENQRFKEKVPFATNADPADIFWQIYQSKQPLALGNLKDFHNWHQILGLSRPKAWLGVPLLYQDEVMGMLSLVRAESVPYTEEEITVAMTFASQASIAIQNARLYDHVTRFNEHLEEQVQVRTEELSLAYSQLERLDKAKSDFIAVTAHELRTPITIIKGYAQILQQMMAGPGNESQAGLIDGVVSGVDRLHQIVNTMLLMVKIDNQELQIYPGTLFVHHLLGEIADDLRPDLANRQQTLFINEGLQQLPAIEADKDYLKVALLSVIINAIKYTPDGGEIQVQGCVSQLDSGDGPSVPAVEIVIHDSGIGIAAEALELIFTKFYQTGSIALHSSGRAKFKGGGPGLGLTIAQGIIEAHGGKIWAASAGHDEENCPGSAFHILLPL